MQFLIFSKRQEVATVEMTENEIAERMMIEKVTMLRCDKCV